MRSSKTVQQLKRGENGASATGTRAGPSCGADNDIEVGWRPDPIREPAEDKRVGPRASRRMQLEASGQTSSRVGNRSAGSAPEDERGLLEEHNGVQVQVVQKTSSPKPHHRGSYSTTLRQQLKATVMRSKDDLRGICLKDVLAGRSKLFARRGAMAGEASFALSEPVETIDFFVSHSWDTPRLHKYLAVLLEFNLWRATVVALGVQTLVMCAELLRHDELLDAAPWAFIPASSVVDFTKLTITGLCPLVTCAVFALVLLNAHRADARMGRTCFLDIACIPQGSEEARARGIASLGALLDRSEQMLVLMDERYWTRLWCAFEIAAFAKRAGVARMRVVPLHVPMLESAALLWMVALESLNAVASYAHKGEELGLSATVELVLLVPATALLLLALAAGQRSEQALDNLSKFRLQECQCYDPRDRKALLALIGEWWTSEDASDETKSLAERHKDGWHRFEMYVRHNLRLHIEASTGDGATLAVSRRCLMAMAVLNNSQYLSMYASPRTNGYSSFMLVTVMLSTYAFAFPLIFRATSALARGIAPLRRRCGACAAYCLLVPLTSCLVMAIFELPHLPLAVAHGWQEDSAYRAPDNDGMDALQLRVFKLQLYVFAAIAGGGVRI